MAVLWCARKCRRIVPIGTDRDDPSLCFRMVTVREGLSVVLENIHGGVMVCEEMSADRPDRDGS